MTRLIASSPEKIHRFEVTDSTNKQAILRANAGGDDGEVFIADHQTAGRGRLTRSWDSPAGKNLYISFLLKPALKPAQALPVTLVAAVAVFETLSAYLPWESRDTLKIKWPNDLYLGDRKIAGVLTEMESEESKVRWVVSGIGVNLNAATDDFSPEVQNIATSIKIVTGAEIKRDNFTKDLIGNFEKVYLGFLEYGPGAVIAFCNQHSYLAGLAVKVAEGKTVVTGIAKGLDNEGYLIITDDEGQDHKILGGDVVLNIL